MRVEQGERRVTRCAIYTRKSTEEGLDQEFNSLDAQREACAAYILSQRHEGWTMLPELYDDGGFSGGNMERPGIKKLLAEVAAKRVDVIVVYKVDRLTRSLGDFAKIVDVLDAAGASFVSVTQSFNTTTSMGRLTLNVLLSFAQFEREVTGERIRDKIAASKKKGLWMGGSVPLGYDQQGKKLVVNEDEADTVRHIYRRYLELRSLIALNADLARAGIVSKRRITKTGNRFGGTPYRVGGLANLLRNRTYLGQIQHKGNVYDAEHAAVVPVELWDAAQAVMAENRIVRKSRKNAKHRSMLTGLLYDRERRRMVADHAVKGQRRYRYYVSKCDGVDDRPILRFPAIEVERVVIGGITRFLASGAQIDDALTLRQIDPAIAAGAIAAAHRVSKKISAMRDAAQLELVQSLAERIDIGESSVRIALSVDRLLHLEERSPHGISGVGFEPIEVDVAIRFKTRGRELRMVVADEPQRDRRDNALIAVVARAYGIRMDMEAGKYRSLDECADARGYARSHMMRLLRISYLPRASTTAILNGQQPVELTAAVLQREMAIPMRWKD